MPKHCTNFFTRTSPKPNKFWTETNFHQEFNFYNMNITFCNTFVGYNYRFLIITSTIDKDIITVSSGKCSKSLTHTSWWLNWPYINLELCFLYFTFIMDNNYSWFKFKFHILILIFSLIWSSPTSSIKNYFQKLSLHPNLQFQD